MKAPVTHMFFLDKRNQFHLDSIAKIAKDSENVKLLVVDFGSFDYPLQAPWRVPNEYGKGSPGIANMFNALGADYCDAASLHGEPLSLSQDEIEKIETAVRSTSISYLQTFEEVGERAGFFTQVIRGRLRRQASKAMALSIAAIQEFRPEKIYIENGRFAVSQANLLAARRFGVKVIFPELQSEASRLYLRTFRVHDRVAMQEAAKELTAQVSRATLEKLTDQWKSRWRPVTSELNPFTALWDTGDIPWLAPDEHIALFATSSTDEFAALDLDWALTAWESQLAAFQAVWDRLSHKELTPVLRIHPNLLNKHPLTAFRELKEFKEFSERNPRFKVIWPASSVNTYELIKRARVVIVHGSTVGLEASLEGLPVVCTNRSIYDLIADVTNVNGPEDLSLIDSMSHTSSPLGAMKLISYLEMTHEGVGPNEAGVNISKVRRTRLIWGSILSGSMISMIFEKRWRLARKVVLAISPKEDLL